MATPEEVQQRLDNSMRQFRRENQGELPDSSFVVAIVDNEISVTVADGGKPSIGDRAKTRPLTSDPATE